MVDCRKDPAGRTDAETRAHIRDLHHVRQWLFPIVPDTLAAAREEN